MSLSAHLVIVSLLSQIERVRLSPARPIGQEVFSMPTLLAFGVLALATGLALILKKRSNRRRPQLERAFVGLARRLGLSRRRRRLVEQLAQRVNVPAVALIISEHAFDHAASSLEPVVVHAIVPDEARINAVPRTGGLTDAALLSLRHALFGER